MIKSCFFEKESIKLVNLYSKTDKDKKEKTQITTIRNEREAITIDIIGIES